MGGKAIIFSAPSGAGKTTIVKEILRQQYRLEFSISASSRQKRKGEVDGQDYYFLSIEEFKNKIKNNEFLEWEEVYKNHFYGTLRSEIDRIWKKGNNIIFEVDVVGGINLKKALGNKALAIFIRPPSIKVLKNRLINRSTEDEDQIQERIEKAKYELSFADEFDVQIINDNLQIAIEKAKTIIFSFLFVK